MQTLRRLIDTDTYALADLALATLAAGLWLVLPRLGGWLLIAALLPWVPRLLAWRFPIRRTPLDLALAVFMITAGAGVWAAYDRALALDKFVVVLLAVAIYYALAGQPRENWIWIARAATALAVWIALVFLLTTDWQTQNADVDLVNRLIRLFAARVPNFGPALLRPNVAGGFLAALIPLQIGLGLRGLLLRRPADVIASGLGLTISLLGFLLTSSRGAWLALAAGLGLWTLWGASGWAARRLGRPRRYAFFPLLGLTAVAAIVLVGTYPGGLLGLANRLPGLASGTTRLALWQNTLALVGDTAFTGGGLASFAGLYSRYAMGINVHLFAYAHNLYLDLLMEQGVFGLLAFVAVWWGSAVRLGRRYPGANQDQGHILAWAVAVGLFEVTLRGLVDDAFYGVGGTPLLFVLPGAAVALAHGEAPAPRWPWRSALAGAAVALSLAAFVAWFPPARAAWLADLGAVRLARAELDGWPGNQDFVVRDRALFDRARDDLLAALQADGRNRTALHRLGVMALRRNDVASAVAYLEEAYAVDPQPRGIRKSLGYAYTWQGQIEPAAALLAGIPEAGQELSTYAWWWGTQGRDDLSQRAGEVAQRLGAP